MRQLSPTTLIGLAKIIVILTCAGAWLFGAATPGKVALVMAFVNGALSSVGFMKTQDATPPQPEGLERKD
jgi:hypothetical protein